MEPKNFSGTPIVISAPSGAGKTSLVEELLTTLSCLKLSISHTTRPMRSGEKNGTNYYFVSDAEFAKMIHENQFIEHAKVFDYHYGTSYQSVIDELEQGNDVIFEIDWQGAKQIRRIFENALSIFILPPSVETLRERLEKRGRDDAEIIEKRMQKAKNEISHYHEFDYLVVNDDFTKAVKDLSAIVLANRLRLSKQRKKYEKLLCELLSDA